MSEVNDFNRLSKTHNILFVGLKAIAKVSKSFLDHMEYNKNTLNGSHNLLFH